MKTFFIAMGIVMLVGCSSLGTSNTGQSGKQENAKDNLYKGGTK